LQVNYLGFPGTMGASYIDYIIADPAVIPEQHQSHFAENVLLPAALLFAG
jgi:predicted O-linked N-acetylglucosamine transferase (SPINDLY family)